MRELYVLALTEPWAFPGPVVAERGAERRGVATPFAQDLPGRAPGARAPPGPRPGP